MSQKLGLKAELMLRGVLKFLRDEAVRCEASFGIGAATASVLREAADDLERGLLPIHKWETARDFIGPRQAAAPSLERDTIRRVMNLEADMVRLRSQFHHLDAQLNEQDKKIAAVDRELDKHVEIASERLDALERALAAIGRHEPTPGGGEAGEGALSPGPDDDDAETFRRGYCAGTEEGRQRGREEGRAELAREIADEAGQRALYGFSRWIQKKFEVVE